MGSCYKNPLEEISPAGTSRVLVRSCRPTRIMSSCLWQMKVGRKNKKATRSELTTMA